MTESASDLDEGVASVKTDVFIVLYVILKRPSVNGHPRGPWTPSIKRWEWPGRKY